MRLRIAAAGTVLLVVVAWMVGLKVGERRARSSHLEASIPSAGTPLATFADGQISAGQLRALLGAMSEPARAGLGTVAARRQLVQDLARTELLAREARRRGLHLDPGYVLQQSRSLAMLLTRLVEQEGEKAAAPLTEQDLRAYYDRHRADFVRPERVRVAILLRAAGPSGAGREEARGAARNLLVELRRGEAQDPGLFSRLAREHSEDAASAPAGGDLSFQSREELSARVDPQAAEAAFGLDEIGRTGERLIETPRGFYLLRLLGREPALDLPFEKVRDLIRQRLESERRVERQARFLAELEKQADLRIDEAALQALQLEVLPAGVPAASPASQRSAVPDSEVEK